MELARRVALGPGHRAAAVSGRFRWAEKNRSARTFRALHRTGTTPFNDAAEPPPPSPTCPGCGLTVASFGSRVAYRDHRKIEEAQNATQRLSGLSHCP